MPQPIAVRKPQATELSMDPGEDLGVGTPSETLTPDEMFEAGLISEDQLTYHVLRVGEKVFDFGDGTKEGSFEGKMIGDDGGDAVLYTVKGQPRIMPFLLAEQRLKKRFPTGHRLAGQRMFFKRPPVPREEPKFECPSKWMQHDRKFWSERQAERHLESRHPAEWKERERTADRDLQLRAIKASERQAELQELQLEFMKASRENGTPASVIPMEPTEEISIPTEEITKPSQNAKRDGLLKYIAEKDWPTPEGSDTMSAADLRAYVLAMEPDE